MYFKFNLCTIFLHKFFNLLFIIILLPLYGSPEGFLGSGAAGIADEGSLAQLLIQLEGIFVICLWTGIATWLILKVTSIFIDIRVSSESEDKGLDVSEHNEQAYNL